ncbi:MAG: ABC transporter substrate-binding protein [Pseudonocardiaceae bacterium]
MRRGIAVAAVTLAGALALIGYLTKAQQPTVAQQPTRASTPGKAHVATDVGVTGSEISLGALTDHSGPLSALGLSTVAGSRIWVDETNSAGGVCGRKITLTVRDHGSDPGKAKVHYTALEPTVLGFLQVLDAPVNAALSQSLIDDEITAVAVSQSSELLGNPYVIIPGATYDIEMINGLSYLMQQGKIRDGDTIGHLWIDGEYGANALRGTRYFAAKHNLTVRDVKVSPTDSDLRGVVAGLVSDSRMRAIALSVTPAQTVSVAQANPRLPMVGNNPAFAPQLLDGPAALGNLSVVASSVPFSAEVPRAQHVAQAFQQGRFEGPPSSGVPYGYAIGEVWGQLLQRACTNGDLTRAGIQEALRQITGVTTDDLVADLDFAEPGAPAARQVYIGVPDATVPGRLRQVTPLFAAPEAVSYAAPHQNGD